MRDLSTYKKYNMKKGHIDTMLLWTIIFVGFTGFFLFVSNYTHALLIKKNVNSLTEYASRTKGLGQDDLSISNGLNNMLLNTMTPVLEEDIQCSDDGGIANKREIVFTIDVTYSSKFFPSINTISGKASTYNDDDAVIQTCTLDILME